MMISIPEFSLVIMIGGTGSGKTTFVNKHFSPDEIISSDTIRKMITGAEGNEDNTVVFSYMNTIISERLKRKLTTVVDATHLNEESRHDMIMLAKKYYALPIAFVMNTSLTKCLENNNNRVDSRPEYVVRNHNRIARSLYPKYEGFSQIEKIDYENDYIISRHVLRNNKKSVHGPFDIIGDIHGCYDELIDLMKKCGYIIKIHQGPHRIIHTIYHLDGRKLVFLGDLCDRGPKIMESMFLVMDIVNSEMGYCVRGNHDQRFLDYLEGKEVSHTHGFKETIEQLSVYDGHKRDIHMELKKFFSTMNSYILFDDGKLVASHCGIDKNMIGGAGIMVSNRCVFGNTRLTAKKRYEWIYENDTKALQVFGHLSVMDSKFINNAICLDNGCVYGYKLTALKYPELSLVSENAHSIHYKHDDILTLEPMCKKYILTLDAAKLTELRGVPCIDGFESIDKPGLEKAFESVVRFCDVNKITYIPPTTATAGGRIIDGCLEHPEHAYNMYRKYTNYIYGQEKHMGSRCVIVIARDRMIMKNIFGIDAIGFTQSRSGRQFLNDNDEKRFIEILYNRIEENNLWNILGNWIVFDGEMLPWSYKAEGLIRDTFLATSCAIQSKQAQEDYVDINKYDINAFQKACMNYASPYKTFDDLEYAPFHILVSEKIKGYTMDHQWHMNIISHLRGRYIRMTKMIHVNLEDTSSQKQATNMWTDLISNGCEGMIFKSPSLNYHHDNELVIMGIKVRGPEYLRLVYGADYLNNLESLSKRKLKSKQFLSKKGNAFGLQVLEHIFHHNRNAAFETNLCALSLSYRDIDKKL